MGFVHVEVEKNIKIAVVEMHKYIISPRDRLRSLGEVFYNSRLRSHAE